MARVAELLDTWSTRLGHDEVERLRWRAAGYLHDALRDAPADQLRARLSGTEPFPDALLHGPAAAELLREEGVDDEELLAAVAYHTIGDPALGRLGRALYAADFLEPGRTFLPELRADLRKRAPDELDFVVMEVARERLRNLVQRGLLLHRRTVAFWNALVEESGE
jgi:HD superfamily phosphohydrolase YqeK